MKSKRQSYETRRKKDKLRRRLKLAKEREERAILLKSMIQTERDFTTEFKITEFKNLFYMFPDDFLPLQEDIRKMKNHSAYDPKDILKSIEQKQNENRIENNVELSEANETEEIDTELTLDVQRKETDNSAGQVSNPVKMEIEVIDYAIPTTSSCVENFENKNSIAVNHSNNFWKSTQGKKKLTEVPIPTPVVVDIKTEFELEEYKIDFTPLESKSDAVIIVQSAQPGVYDVTEESNLNSPTEIKTEIEESDFILG